MNEVKKVDKKIVALTAATVLLIASNVYWLSQRPIEKEPDKVLVRFAYQFGFHYGQHIIMDHLNLVEKWSNETAVAEYLIIKGGTAQSEAFAARSLEFGSMGAPPAIKGAVQGIGIKIFASMGCKQTRIWTWRDDIDSLADIKSGDQVNVIALKSLQQLCLIKALTELGRTVEEVNEMSVFYSHPDAYQLIEQREIDVVFASPPYNAIYDADENYHCIGDDSSIWGVPLPGSVLVGRIDFVEEHPDIAAAVFMAWLEATSWINNHPEKAAEIIGEVYGYDLSKVWEQWQDAHLTFNPTFGLSALQDYVEVMYDVGIIDSQPSEEDLLFAHVRGMLGH